MMGIDRWNALQIRVFRRFARRHGVPLTAELVTLLAHRFARKHVRAIADGRWPTGARRANDLPPIPLHRHPPDPPPAAPLLVSVANAA